MYKQHTVAVVIPAYNEAGFVGEVIDTVPEFVDRIYAVDDRSTDDTWTEICEHAEQINDQFDTQHFSTVNTDKFSRRVVPIRHEQNAGVGGAIKTGYRRARADGMDIVAVMNGDGQMDPDILDRVIDPIATGEADYVKGNRLLYPEYREEMSTWRFFGNTVLSVLTKAASGYWKMSDPQNGYTAISYRALSALELDELYDRYGFLNHLLIHLNLRNFRISDVAMAASYGDESSKISYRSFVPGLSKLLVRSFLGRLKIKYLVFDFHPLVVLYAFGFLGITGSVSGLTGLVWRGYGDGSGVTIGVLFLFLFIVGVLFTTLAAIYDMQHNAPLENQRYGLVSDEQVKPELDQTQSAGEQSPPWNR
jgi:glycosyltransferase involved in cell wall biosynthesis